MAQQADMQKRLEYMNQVVQNSSLNAQCILGNNKRELQDNILFLQAKIIHHLYPRDVAEESATSRPSCTTK